MDNTKGLDLDLDLKPPPPQSSYAVDEQTGSVFVGINIAARLLGVNATHLKRRVAQSHEACNGYGQLNPALLVEIASEQAQAGNIRAIRTLTACAERGVLQFLYSEVDYQPPVQDTKPDKYPRITRGLAYVLSYGLPDRFWGLLEVRELKDEVRSVLARQTPATRPDGSMIRTWKPHLKKAEFADWCLFVVKRLDKIEIPSDSEVNATCAERVEAKLKPLNPE